MLVYTQQDERRPTARENLRASVRDAGEIAEVLREIEEEMRVGVGHGEGEGSGVTVSSRPRSSVCPERA